MARKPRIEFKGCLYHVMAKGNNGEFIFNKTEDKYMYMQLIEKYKEMYPFKLYAYCIMANHVHLLIEQENTPLSKIMQGIQQSFTQRYNRKHSRSGHVFQQRYKAEICNKDDYLFQLIKYIHNNPVKADIEGGLNYMWSSHNEYMGANNNGLIDKEYILELFAKDNNKAVREYSKFINSENSNEEENIEDYFIRDFKNQIWKLIRIY